VRPIGVHSPGYIADSDEQAREELWPDYKRMRDRIGAERGWPPMQRAEFDREAATGSLYVGSPETVARRIASTARTLGISRFDMKYSAGALFTRNSCAASASMAASDSLVRELLMNEASPVPERLT